MSAERHLHLERAVMWLMLSVGVMLIYIAVMVYVYFLMPVTDYTGGGVTIVPKKISERMAAPPRYNQTSLITRKLDL